MLYEEGTYNEEGEIGVVKAKISIKLKAHESFYIREGWLRKGLISVSKDKFIFVDEYATDKLGIGANMVKSLRYWMQTLGLTEEVREKENKRGQVLTEDLGEIVLENDEYFEDIFTLWILHYKLVTNFSSATSWYLFFNKLNVTEINKANMLSEMTEVLMNMDSDLTFSEKSLKDDCTCIIKTYYADDNDLKNPEDNLISPFSELKLLKRKLDNKKEEVFEFAKADSYKLDKLAVFYVIVDNIRKSKSNNTTIEKLLNDCENIGKVFNLDKNSVNEYLDLLENEELIDVNRTAGLNVIYLKDNNIQPKDVLNMYYSAR